MPCVHYLAACSIDGFIADEHHSLDWLFEVPHADTDTFWDRWFPEVGALVMGATTYRWAIDHDHLLEHPHKWSECYGDRPAWVFSHRPQPSVPGVDVAFVAGDVRPVYGEIAARIGSKNIWVVGGGELAGQLHDAGLLDQIIVGMMPVTLGAGAPLLPRRISSGDLTIRSAELIGQRVRVVMDVRSGRSSAR